jgi:hypothetical protein
MADGRKNNGGHKNSGRKSKDEEQKLADRLKFLDPKAIAALENGIDSGKDWAVKLYFDRVYGGIQKNIDLTSGGEAMKQQILNIDPLSND